MIHALSNNIAVKEYAEKSGIQLDNRYLYSGQALSRNWELGMRGAAVRLARGWQRDYLERGEKGKMLRGSEVPFRSVRIYMLEGGSKISAAKEVSGYRPIGSGQ